MTLALSRHLQNFDWVCQQKFGRTYDFIALEKHFRDHANGKRHLTAKDVGKIFSAENTPFAKYWPKPNVKPLDELLSKERVHVGPLTHDLKGLVQRLLGVFHNIGTASLVLRFVHPDRFGIFSTPVIHLLQVTRPATVDLYLAYCEALGRWCRHFGLPSVAQTETALWTYAEVTKLADTDPDAAKTRREFDNDMWVQRERVAQVIRPFLSRYGRLQLAQILLDEDPIIAGKIAAEEYERLLGMASWHVRHRALPQDKGAKLFLEELARDHYIRPEDNVELKRVWEIRNKAVHPVAGDRPKREEVEVMIDVIQRVCVPWEKQGLRRSAPETADDK